jgi:hypothetical protein
MRLHFGPGPPSPKWPLSPPRLIYFVFLYVVAYGTWDGGWLQLKRERDEEGIKSRCLLSYFLYFWGCYWKNTEFTIRWYQGIIYSIGHQWMRRKKRARERERSREMDGLVSLYSLQHAEVFKGWVDRMSPFDPSPSALSAHSIHRLFVLIPPCVLRAFEWEMWTDACPPFTHTHSLSLLCDPSWLTILSFSLSFPSCRDY